MHYYAASCSKIFTIIVNGKPGAYKHTLYCMKIKKQTSANSVNLPRRLFLRYAGAGAASAGLLAVSACHKDHKVVPFTGVDVGQGDTGIFNFTYAIKQVEAAFYSKVVLTPYAGITTDELTLITAIRDQEIAHCAFLKATAGNKAIAALTPDFGSINFTDRLTVLFAAKKLEDTGVMAYGGLGYLIKNPAYLTIAAKMASVEARHAAVIGNQLQQGYFASDVGSNGLNSIQSTGATLIIINQYLKTKVSAVSFNYVLT
jgi:hypothetical protein